ncbi:hypothetical protein [Pseudonocardia sp. MH-G8]|uniref:hypothetical protein n=1 Tax=Pseudonocardia sp. MH-G8 TaxID=1854588 RepID=UPI000BA04E0F|nr:hypothetical protein [Pseudonocardia sp. MH-G8]OZM79500.1 hypothetical protein CFP66_25350 [Pseudonocardia sp. MH-G8]
MIAVRRRLLLAGLAASAVAGGGPPGPPWRSDPDATLRRLAGSLDPDQDYRAPTADERAAVPAAIDRLVSGNAGPDAVAMFDRLAMDLSAGTDPATGRPFLLAASRPGAEESWGAVVVDRGAEPSVVVEVPHPVADRDTEHVGLALFRAVPGAVLLVGGAHRRAAGEHADVAHHEDSFFHAVAGHLGARGMPELQLHGFGSASLPAVDAVVSAGAGTAGLLTMLVADELDAAGPAVCRAWRQDCGALEGRTNAQGRAAAVDGRPFVHVELSRAVRGQARRGVIVEALARAVVPV